MLKIRLQRTGRKHEPTFRLVLTDSKNSTKSGRFKEVLGSYDPRKSVDSIDADRVKFWLTQGVKTTETVHNLLVTHKVISGDKIKVKMPMVEKKEEAPAEEVAETPATEAPVADVVPETVVETPTPTEASE